MTIDQHANMVSLLQQLIQDARKMQHLKDQHGLPGLASVQATTSGIIDVNGEKILALRGNRLSDGAPLTVYPVKFLRVCPVRRSGISKASSLKRFARR